ncbi:MAG: SLC13 family permease [Planctomycetes bacterium]|nr:SLC13 family permease [Planctomycetota bacterium]
MSFDAWFTLAVLAVAFLALVRNLAPPDLVFLCGTTLLALFGVINAKEAFAGFANEGMLTVAVLFVVAAGLEQTGVLAYVGQQILGGARTDRGALARLSAVIVSSSAFLNNTPIVAMFMPVVVDWCRRNNVAPSKLLIPLSYLAILGGTCTLIGTSTNVVVHGLMRDSDIASLERGMSLFEITPLGVPYALAGVAYLLTMGRRLLPERKELFEQLGESRREYMVDMLVQPECRLIGRSVEAAGLRNLPGLFLIEINRGDEIITPVAPNEVIEANDRLVFTGVVSSVVELQKIAGLVPIADPAYEAAPARQLSRRMCEAVISADSPLIGETIRDADFRATYGAAVVAVHRGGARVQEKVGDIKLQPGDTLLLQTQPHFVRAHRNDPAFYLVSDVEQWRPLRSHRAWIAMLLFVALLVLMTTGIVPILIGASLIAVLMIATGCLSAGEARQSIELQVLITIAASFGIGTALEKSGAAEAIANQLVHASSVFGPVGTLACVYILTSILTELITNNAAAVLLFPICIQAARLSDNVDPRPFVIALTFAASASLMTPIGYQTNMMVYGPGGYRFTDFIRVGLPLHIILLVMATVLIPIIWPL